MRGEYTVVVEDDDLIRELISRWLQEAGHRVVSAHHATSPTQGRPQLVIANVPNPQQAQPLLARLRAQYGAPILVVSARFQRGVEQSSLAANMLGADAVLPKPFTREDLLTAVALALRNRA